TPAAQRNPPSGDAVTAQCCPCAHDACGWSCRASHAHAAVDDNASEQQQQPAALAAAAAPASRHGPDDAQHAAPPATPQL
ncbi:hypothetical protein EC988_007605, partial [Linderina pennispora]